MNDTMMKDQADDLFPIGYHKVHPIKIIDYQLNRWYSLGFYELSDIKILGANIKGIDDWKPKMIEMADHKLKHGEKLAAAMYYRGAEFFTMPDDPDKYKLYQKFRHFFYQSSIVNSEDCKYIPYDNGFIPAMRYAAKGKKTETLLIFGGFDSFMEEFCLIAQTFTKRGIEVICFEGPGQGEPLKDYGLKMIIDWEKPTKAVLDHFNLEEASLMGISMGGWWAIRAAAFEPRITKVIALGVGYDYLEILPKWGKKLLLFFMKFKGFMNHMARIKMKLIPQERWSINNLMHLTGAKTPMDASQIILQMNKENIASEKVTQDVLLLSGAKDHFIPVKMHHLQVKALKNAQSVTDHIFTKKDAAEDHCMVGNMSLAINTITAWLELKTKSKNETDYL
ncbi:alpha/beta hydrolase [bacterium SCSIO 12741]|nr:alpha/beta hydrolase [bacterium SCSIO 12741]